MTATRTINNWTPETRSLLRRIKREGFTYTDAWDSEEWEKITSEKHAIDVLTAVDESYLRIVKGDFRSTLMLVYGNSPGELVSDYSFPQDSEETEAYKALERVTDGHMEAWEDRKQPTKEVS